jgi:4a-hydroxytetrahydrobiopterin dehydratase
MTTLSKLSCEACSTGAQPLTNDEIDSMLFKLSGWELIIDSDIKKLKRQFHTEKYHQSVAFTNAIASLAESTNHHPQIILEYSSVTIIWWTHVIHGLHKNDFILAAKTSELFKSD